MDFDSVFRKYHHRLYLFTLKFIENESDALDIVQNVFLSVWENEKYGVDEKMVQSYLFSAVKNSCLNFIKHRKVIRKYEQNVVNELKEMEAYHFQSGEKSLIEKESLKQLDDAINSLSDIYKEVIVLSRYEGLKNNEIAKQLNISVRTVETRIFRALILLKTKISPKSFLILMHVFSTKAIKDSEAV
jgi:RNA polymerase sigma-70 factor (ECF subfamily)